MPDTPVGDGTADYALTSADLGASIYCKVTATNASGTANANSNTVGPVAAAPVGGPATTNMWCWLKADAGVYSDAGTTPATNGGIVARWADQSSTGTRHFNQATAANQPTWVTNAINTTLPVVQFNNQSPDAMVDYFTGPDASALTAGEVFIVVKVANDPAVPAETDGHLWCFGTSGLDALYPYTDVAGHIYEDWGAADRYDCGNASVSLTSFRLYNVVSTATEWANYIDGTLLYNAGTVAGVGFSTTPVLGSSVGVNPALQLGMHGDVAEMIIYSAKCSAPDKTTTKTYLAAKYGLTIA